VSPHAIARTHTLFDALPLSLRMTKIARTKKLDSVVTLRLMSFWAQSVSRPKRQERESGTLASDAGEVEPDSILGDGWLKTC
ncbi:MAG: hypothetical protein WAM44_21995, partial [Chthoniobacterales bacterium]